VAVGSAIGVAAMIVVILAAISAVRKPREDRANAGRAPTSATAVQREPEQLPPSTVVDPIPTVRATEPAIAAIPPATASVVTTAIARPVVHARPASAAPKATGKSAKSPSAPDDGF